MTNQYTQTASGAALPTASGVRMENILESAERREAAENRLKDILARDKDNLPFGWTTCKACDDVMRAGTKYGSCCCYACVRHVYGGV